MAMTPEAQKAFLTGLTLTTDVVVEAPATPPRVVLAPEGVDPHTMPVTDIVFDPRLLDEFPDLTGANMKRASEKVFALYRSPNRDKDRHALLHRRITEFIGQVRSKTGGHVKEMVKATSQERELAKLLAAKGLTVEDLAALIATGKEENK